MKGSSVNAVWKTENSILNLKTGSMKIWLNEKAVGGIKFYQCPSKNFRQRFHSFYWVEWFYISTF
jgi:hypothetical protein